MNGRNVDQIIRQCRQHRVGRLAVATMFYEKEARRRDQERRGRGQLVAAQRASEYQATSVRRKPVSKQSHRFPVLYPFVFQLPFVSADENRERRAGSVPECGCRPSGHHQNTTVRPSRVLDRYNVICCHTMVMNYKCIYIFLFCVRVCVRVCVTLVKTRC